jgi:hypothetical protein
MRWKYPNDPQKKWQPSSVQVEKEVKSKKDGLQNYYDTDKVLYDGHKFDSALEKRFYISLRDMKKNNLIKDFKCQVSYEIIPTTKLEGMKRANRKTTYTTDFVVEMEDGREFIIDSKGYSTDVFKLKKKIFEHKHQQRIYVLKNLNELDNLILGGENNG